MASIPVSITQSARSGLGGHQAACSLTLGWGAKRIAREVGVARNRVRRYLREGEAAEKQVRPGARTLNEVPGR
jgi:hypothetical protein